jgi:hypothetical protein
MICDALPDYQSAFAELLKEVTEKARPRVGKSPLLRKP